MKKSNNNNDKEKNSKIDKSSNGFSQKRSSKFDDITRTNNRPNNYNDKKNPKEVAKKTWKYTSIGIYLFLLILAIIGLIQSCVLKSNSIVGSGIELYNKKSDVAPYVTNYSIEEKTEKVIDYDQNGRPKLDNKGNIIYTTRKYYSLVQKTKRNYLTSKETIEKIKRDLNQYSHLYGIYNNFSSAIRVEGTEKLPVSDSAPITGSINGKELITGDDGSIIFMNDRILKYMNQNSISYQAKNTWEEINYFVLSRPENWDDLSNPIKDYYGSGIDDLTYAFQPFENVGTEANPNWVAVETRNGSFVTKDSNGDGIIDSEDYIVITNPERISKFKYSLNAEVASLSKNNTGLLNSEIFARDYSQSLLNILVRFSQLNDFYSLLNAKTNSNINTDSTSSQIFSSLTKTNLEKLVNPRIGVKNTGLDQRAFNDNMLFTLQQKNAIITYQNEIKSLVTSLGFGIRRQVYSNEKSEYYESSNTTPFKIEFRPNVKNKENIVLGSTSVPQKPITSWGEAWGLGPFYGLIVYPFAFIIKSMMVSMPTMNGWNAIIAIVITILLTRVIVTIFTYKSLFASHKQQQLNPKKAKIDAKYEQFKGNREMEQRKRQEIAKLYKSHNISMLDPLKAICIQMPIFFAVWRIIQGITNIKATTWLGIQFSLTSWKELFDGAWQYFPLLLFAALTQLVSHLLPKFLNKKRMDERANKAEIAALKKANKTQNIMMIVFIFISVMFEAGIQIYWIIAGLWQIMQILVVHHIIKSDWYRTTGHKYL